MEIGGTAFNGFDIVVIGVVVISMLMAAARGLGRELVSILALFVSLAVALFLWGTFRQAAQDFIDPAWLADGALALGSFAVTYMLIVFAMRSLAGGLADDTPGLLNRLLGATFGGLRGLIVMALFVMVPTASYIADRDRLAERDEEYAQRDDIPDDIRRELLTPQQSLPDWLDSSSTYPILERIGDVIRTLPFGEIKGVTDDLREGRVPELEDL